MRRKFMFILLVYLVLTAACSLFRTVYEERYQHRYLPVQLRNIHLNQPRKQTLKTRKGIELVESLYEFRTMGEETFEEGDIRSVTYYFDNDLDQPLYELILVYADRSTLERTVNELYGTPNFENGEWKFVSQEGFDIRIWSFDTTLVIAGFIEGTEWNE